MKIAIIDKKDITLKIVNNSIKIEEQTIPFKLIDMLILNHKTTLHTKDILKLTQNDISILLVSYNNNNFSIINSANTKNSAMKLAQYNSLHSKIIFAKYFIKNKLISHFEQLKKHNIEMQLTTKLQQLESAKEIHEIMGIEGSFAREYFKHYFSLFPKGLHKGTRSKQPPRDPVNALLSYWYSLYYNIITVQLLKFGFECGIGYLHTPFRMHNALASDFLELFRAPINQAVLAVFSNKLLTVEDFSKKGGVYLKYSGRKKVWGEFMSLVAVLKPKLDKEIAEIRRMVDEANSHH